jgi:hypothetical protein
MRNINTARFNKVKIKKSRKTINQINWKQKYRVILKRKKINRIRIIILKRKI